MGGSILRSPKPIVAIALVCLAFPSHSQPVDPEAAAIAALELAERAYADAWSLRGLKELSAESRLALARGGRPIWHEVTARDGETLAEAVATVCGVQPANVQTFIEATAMQLNLVSDLGVRLREGEVVAIPFCLRVDESVSVVPEQGQTGRDLLEYNYVIAGPETAERFARINGRNVAEAWRAIDRVQLEGTPVTIPYRSVERIYVPRTLSDDPLAIVREHDTDSVQSQAAFTFRRVTPTAETPSPPTGPQVDPITGAMLPQPPPPSLLPPPPLERTRGFVELISAVDPPPQCGGQPGQNGTIVNVDELATAYVRQAMARDDLGFMPPRPARVGIIDTGLQEFNDAYFLKRFFFVNPREREPADGIDGDDALEIGQTFIDDVYGASIDGSSSFLPLAPDGRKDIGHGTQMASLILGGPGQAHSWLEQFAQPPIQIRMLNFTVAPLTTGPAHMEEAEKLPIAINYLASNDVDIINLSLATQDNLPLLRSTIREHKKILFLAASGNGPVGPNNSAINLLGAEIVPAMLGGFRREPNVITIGAHDISGKSATFSNYSALDVDVLAPGCNILARDHDGNVAPTSGTSVATAVAAFTAGLLRSLGLSNPDEIRRRLIAGSDFDPELDGVVYAAGRLNLLKAISVYEDVIEFRDESRAPVAAVIADPGMALAACENASSLQINRSKLLKIIPNLANGRLEYWLEDDNQVVRVPCKQRTGANTGALTIDGQSADPIPVESIKEIVFASPIISRP